MCPRSVLPSAHARRARRPGMVGSPYERCCTTTSLRRGSPPVLPSACGKRCQQHKQVLQLWRALQRRVVVPVAIIGSAVIRVCERSSSTGGPCTSSICAFERGQRQQQGLSILRAMRRYAIARDVVAYRAALSACEGASSTSRRHISYGRCGALPSRRRGSPIVLPAAGATSASSTSRPYFSYERYRAMPWSRMWSPTVLPAAGAGVSAAPAGLTPLASFPTPGHRAGCVRLQCCRHTAVLIR